MNQALVAFTSFNHSEQIKWQTIMNQELGSSQSIKQALAEFTHRSKGSKSINKQSRNHSINIKQEQ